VQAAVVDQEAYAVEPADGVAPACRRHRGGVAHGHPVDLAMGLGGLAQQAGGGLGERAAGVPQERDHRGASGLESRVRQLARGLARLGRR